ncbi:hypothetical protein, variant [Puccinia striiformis f. sp. tritici PST-78]|uniref:Uncharacterized protein n=1 Tax=Puccinia striiformis f. sp. tritici PST-78 TaxID=1165861 RepID=A0A0L0VW82_9BASI|nr:hypothetical protein, variant [Puccinia striiformis f. sp. tritici PST-78]
MRKVLYSAGAAGKGTALTNQLEENPENPTLLERITTNQKVIALKARIGNTEPTQSIRTESAGNSIIQLSRSNLR